MPKHHRSPTLSPAALLGELYARIRYVYPFSVGPDCPSCGEETMREQTLFSFLLPQVGLPLTHVRRCRRCRRLGIHLYRAARRRPIFG